MLTEEPPVWLPDGWIMEVRKEKNGATNRYYSSPVSGYTFCSKKDVMHYLNIVKHDGHSLSTCPGDNTQQIVPQVNNSFDWLPSGWILEIRIRRSGVKAGQKYKNRSFVDCPIMMDVHQFLKAGKLSSPASKQKSKARRRRTESPENVLAQIEFSSDGLPHGWVKETKFRESKHKCGIRKDPYYTDPATGYVFRTLRDANHYLETGEVSKYAFRPRKSIHDIYSLEKDFPTSISAKKVQSQGTVVRRSLFAGQSTNTAGEINMEVDELPAEPQLPYLEHALSEYAGVEGAAPISFAASINKTQRKAKKRKTILPSPIQKFPEPARNFRQNANEGELKFLEPATRKLLEPVTLFENKSKKGRKKMLKREQLSENSIESLHKKLVNPLERKQLDLADPIKSKQAEGKVLQMSHKKPHELADLAADAVLMNNPLEQANGNALRLRNGKRPGPEGKMFETKKLSEPEEEVLELENKKLSLSKKNKMPDRKVRESGDSTAKTQKAITLPRRASKRLAGLEAAPVDDSVVSYRFRSAILKGRPDRTEGSRALLKGLESKEPCEEQAAQEEAGGEGKPMDDKLELALGLPFGDAWPDPCIEFAFRTLTSDIPEFEDTQAVQDYFSWQFNPVQSLSSHGSTSLMIDGDPVGSTQTGLPFQRGSPDRGCLPSREVGKPCSLKRRLLSSGKVIQECRRSSRLNK